MVKITPELINESPQYFNPLKDREMDLRGLKISVIENLGATYDQFDCMDFSDNEIRKLDGFPLLKRLKHLLLNNNHIYRISENLYKNLPNLQTVIMSSNNISELTVMDVLKNLKYLNTLSLLGNPVTKILNYRYYTIYKLPQLRLLDFQKIKQKERIEAEKMFKTLESNKIVKENVFTPGEKLQFGETKQDVKTISNKKNINAIREAIAKASSLDEIEQLQILLNEGKL